jgi:hypothetical protein
MRHEKNAIHFVTHFGSTSSETEIECKRQAYIVCTSKHVIAPFLNKNCQTRGTNPSNKPGDSGAAQDLSILLSVQGRMVDQQRHR